MAAAVSGAGSGRTGGAGIPNTASLDAMPLDPELSRTAGGVPGARKGGPAKQGSGPGQRKSKGGSSGDSQGVRQMSAEEMLLVKGMRARRQGAPQVAPGPRARPQAVPRGGAAAAASATVSDGCTSVGGSSLARNGLGDGGREGKEVPRPYVRVTNSIDLEGLPNPYGWEGSAASLVR